MPEGGLKLWLRDAHLHTVRVEALLQAYCFETIASCSQPREHAEQVRVFAQDLVQCMALHLAETVADLLQSALRESSGGPVDSSNAPLLSPKFWVQAIRHLWPLQMPAVGTVFDAPARVYMCRERRRLRARHIWERLDLNWPLLQERLFTQGPTGMKRHQLYNLLFCTDYQGTARWKEAPYRGPGATQLRESWNQLKASFQARRSNVAPPTLEMSDLFRAFEEKDAAVRVQTQLDCIQEQEGQIWRTRKGTYRKKQLPDVRDVKMEETWLRTGNRMTGIWHCSDFELCGHLSKMGWHTELFPGQEHMRDECGRSVSPVFHFN